MIDLTQIKLLEIVKYRLFGGSKPEIEKNGINALLKEAENQAVYNIVYPVIESGIQENMPEKYPAYLERHLAKLIVNTGNFHDHGELDKLMTENGIEYVAIKGIASAYYYSDSSLRDMGDVDLLFSESDVERAENAVKTIGYKYSHGESDDVHIAYCRKGLSIVELHRSVNGIPNNDLGKIIEAEVKNSLISRRRIEYASESCFIPDEFHHGLIMLLHMISHLTKEGIGLRHLCDWAVFENSFSAESFRKIFEKRLKEFGLWKFALVLSLVCTKYLGTSDKGFKSEIEADDKFLEDFLSDILNGGNFGTKDVNRYREIKYISDADGNSVSESGVISQLFKSLNAKAKKNKAVKKSKLLLPVGWVAESGKYVGLLLSGKRKTKATSDMLKEASKRKDIYGNLELFK